MLCSKFYGQRDWPVLPESLRFLDRLCGGSFCWVLPYRFGKRLCRLLVFSCNMSWSLHPYADRMKLGNVGRLALCRWFLTPLVGWRNQPWIWQWLIIALSHVATRAMHLLFKALSSTCLKASPGLKLVFSILEYVVINLNWWNQSNR